MPKILPGLGAIRIYKSRRHLTNGKLSLALDSLTGQLLEFTELETGENLLKNHLFALPQPLAVLVGEELLRPADSSAIRENPALRPDICLSPDGRKGAVRYPALWDGCKVRQVAAEFTVELPQGQADSVWNLRLEWGPEETVDSVRFPCLNGIYWGESWEDDTLVYPHYGGLKITNPVTSFAAGARSIQWRWQDYAYSYPLGTLAAPLSGGSFGLEGRYTGTLSMKWLDYYWGGRGLYFACQDPAFSALALRAETFGPDLPGMCFSFVFSTEGKPGGTWQSPPVTAAVHPGDWHTAAERYRAAHREILPEGTAAPGWFRKSAGLAAHYDLKYQNGGIVHRYEDISRLYSKAQALGLDHLLLAGWHQDGFDNGFPQYDPDGDLGTPEELSAQLAAVKALGGHVSLYMNTRIIREDWEPWQDFAQRNAVRQKDGSPLKERAGALEFVVQCAGSGEWREKLRADGNRLTGALGAGGLYLDQLAMGSPGPCYNTVHGHQTGQWNIFYQTLLQDIWTDQQASGRETALLIEGCSDSYGPFCAGQLISTFAYHHCGAFPQLYRYTFPEQILVDMLYPRRGLAMRPVHVAQASGELMDRAFVTGMYFWVYDLEEDNTFEKDPDSLARLKDMIALRRLWLEGFGPGIFRDREHILGTSPGVSLCSHQLAEGLLLACANPTGRVAWAELDFSPRRGVCYTADHLPQGEDWPLESDSCRVLLSPQPQSLLFFPKQP